MKRISSIPKYGTQVILCFMPKNTVPVFFHLGVSLGSQSRLSAVLATKGIQTSQVSHLHHCVLANLKVYHYRPFPSSRLSTTDRLYPGFPARLLRCDLFTAWLAERTSARLLQECHCAPVTAHETANVSELLDMAGRIWRDSILRSEPCIPLRHFSMCVLSACVVSTHET